MNRAHGGVGVVRGSIAQFMMGFAWLCALLALAACGVLSNVSPGLGQRAAMRAADQLARLPKNAERTLSLD